MGKRVYLPKHGCEEVWTRPPLSHRRCTSDEVDVFVGLMNHDFWFCCQSAGINSNV